MTQIFLALGTNLGNREQNLRQALSRLDPQIKELVVSSIYETEPWGYTEQPRFLNQVVIAETELEPLELLDYLKKIEASLKRIATFRNGPRTIDLDILFYDDTVINTPELVIPHAEMANRAFVMLPLVEIAPNFIHPVFQQSIKELAAKLDARGVELYLPNPGLNENQAVGKAMCQQRTYPLAWGSRTFVMGVLNITPDSFSGDGLMGKQDVVKSAVEKAQQFVQAGADILDIGGESTRPGASAVDVQTEMERVLPVIRAIREAQLEIVISVDTYKAKIAHAALEAGADWINDVWALRADPHMAEVVSSFKAPIILMHNRSKPKDAALDQRLGGRYVGSHYQDLLGEIRTELLASVALAQQAGIQTDCIILDSGIGFGKTVEQNLELLNRQDEICEMGFPVLLGPSRKSFIGYMLDASPEERLEGTAAGGSSRHHSRCGYHPGA